MQSNYDVRLLMIDVLYIFNEKVKNENIIQ
jgi:hypothetical protein